MSSEKNSLAMVSDYWDSCATGLGVGQKQKEPILGDASLAWGTLTAVGDPPQTAKNDRRMGQAQKAW